LDPVERRPGGLVVADEAAVRDLVPAAPVLVQLEVEDQATRAGHQPPLVLDAELALGEAGDLAGELLPRRALHSREAALFQPAERVPVLQPQLANADLALEGAEVELGHLSASTSDASGRRRSGTPRRTRGSAPGVRAACDTVPGAPGGR